MEIDPARHERHLDLLDQLAQVGLALAQRLRSPEPGQNVARDFEILSRGIRRTILLAHVLASGTYKLPQPTAPRPEQETDDRETGDRPERPDSPDRLDRIDPLDRLEDVSGPPERVIAAIVRDIRTVLASFPKPPPDVEPETADLSPRRPEADTAILE